VGVSADQEVCDLNAANAGLVATNGGFPDWNDPYIPAVPTGPWGSCQFFDPDYRLNGIEYVVVGSFGPNKIGQNLYDSDDVILKIPSD